MFCAAPTPPQPDNGNWSAANNSSIISGATTLLAPGSSEKGSRVVFLFACHCNKKHYSYVSRTNKIGHALFNYGCNKNYYSEGIVMTQQMEQSAKIDSRILLLALSMFALGTDAFVVAGVLPVIAHETGVTESLAGQLVTAFSLTYGIGAPVLAALTGRWARNTLLLVALGGFCLFNLGSAIAPDYPTLLVTRILVGCAAAVFGPLAYVVGAALAPAEKRGQALAQVASGLTIATVLGSPLGTWVGEHFGWRLSFGLVALLGGIAFVMLLLFKLPKAAPAPALSLATRLAPIREPRLVLAFLPALFWNLGVFVVYTYIALLLRHNLNITDVSLFLLAYGLGPMLGNWICGIVIDRVGSTRPIFFFLVALVIVEPLLMLATHTVVGAFVSLFVWGLCVPMLFTPQQHRLLQLAPEHANVILALNNSTFYLGIAGGAALGGLALRVVAITQLGWLGAACILLALALFAVSVRLSGRPGEQAMPMEESMQREEVLVVPE
jgi:MFS transporter, DHA1 family, inner membrane transport protein